MTATRQNRTTERELFFQMARAFPVRTFIFSFGLPLFGFLQVLNGIVNGGPLTLIGLFALVTIAFSVTLTRYQVAIFGRRTVMSGLQGPDSSS